MKHIPDSQTPYGISLEVPPHYHRSQDLPNELPLFPKLPSESAFFYIYTYMNQPFYKQKKKQKQCITEKKKRQHSDVKSIKIESPTLKSWTQNLD